MKRFCVCPHCGAPMYRDVCEYCQMPAVSPTAPVKKRNYVWLWGVLVAVVLVICVLSAAVLCYYIKGNAYRRTWMVRSTASGTSENDAAVLEKMQENGVFSSGTYLERQITYFMLVFMQTERRNRRSAEVGMNILPLSNWRKGLISAFPGRIAMISQRTAFPMTPQSILGCSVWDGISNRGHTPFVPMKKKTTICIRLMRSTRRLEVLRL